MQRGDFHIHTCLRPIDDGAETMTPPRIAETCRKRGFDAFGLSPHFHAGADPAELLGFLETARSECGGVLPMYCGAEAECTDAEGTLSIPDEAARQLDYVIASGDHFNCTGAVKPPRAAAEHFAFHLELLLKLAANPLVDVIAHPLIAAVLLTAEGHLPGYERMDTLPEIPERWLKTFAGTARSCGTAVEINGFFTSVYRERRAAAGDEYAERYFAFFRRLAEAGVTLSAGSDAHNMEALAQYESAESWLKRLDVPPDQVWSPRRESKRG